MGFQSLVPTGKAAATLSRRLAKKSYCVFIAALRACAA
jgi:hypothetical protein